MRSAVYAATRADHSSGVRVPPSRLRSMSGTTNITGPSLHGVFDARRRVPADLPRPARGARRPGAAHGGGAHRAGRQRARGPRTAAGAGALSRRAGSRFHELRRPVEGGARGRRPREADRGQGRLLQTGPGQPLRHGARVRRGRGARKPQRGGWALHHRAGAGEVPIRPVGVYSRRGQERVRYAKIIFDEGMKALECDSTHDGANHLIGAWHAEVKRLSGFEKFFAKALYGGGFLDKGNWEDAQKYLQKAVALKPQNIFHRLELGEVYVDVGKYSKAREQFTALEGLPIADVLDHEYKQEAKQVLADIKGEKDET